MDSVIELLISTVVLYSTAYKTISFLLTNHIDVFKSLFDLDIRYFNYTNEESLDNKHDILSCFASVICKTVLLTGPILHLCTQLLLYQFINVSVINRILLMMLTVDIMTNYNVSVREFNLKKSWHLILQAFYVMLHYNTFTGLSCAIFQLVDYMFNLPLALVNIRRVFMMILMPSDFDSLHLLVKMVNFCQLNDFAISMTRFVLLCLIIIMFVFTMQTTFSNLVYIYWGIYRLCMYFDILKCMLKP